jgi:transposase-like protein
MMTTAPQTRSQAYKPRFGRKDRPKCADCGRECHTVDKCYKLHGFLQGYKFRGGIKFVV